MTINTTLMNEELECATEALESVENGVSMFGSARVPSSSPVYQKSRELAAELAEAGCTVITGGGPGLMEAANKGAFENGGESVGLNIILPHEQESNNYLSLECDFEYFFTRKTMFIDHSDAFVALPGGLGTLDEISEVLVLMQCGHIDKVPIVLFGVEFWTPLVQWMKDQLAGPYCDVDDLDLFIITDDVDEAVQYLTK